MKMKKFLAIAFSLPVLSYAGKIGKVEFVKNAALIYRQNGLKKIVILKNVEEMDAKIGKKRASVILYMNSGRVVKMEDIPLSTYRSLENTLTNASMRILTEIK